LQATRFISGKSVHVSLRLSRRIERQNSCFGQLYKKKSSIIDLAQLTLKRILGWILVQVKQVGLHVRSLKAIFWGYTVYRGIDRLLFQLSYFVCRLRLFGNQSVCVCQKPLRVGDVNEKKKQSPSFYPSKMNKK
jgi:hypothetical protein